MEKISFLQGIEIPYSSEVELASGHTSDTPGPFGDGQKQNTTNMVFETDQGNVFCQYDHYLKNSQSS